jgi:hypothetical protein
MRVYRYIWGAVATVAGAALVGLGVLVASPVTLFCLGSLVAVAVAAAGGARSAWLASGLLSGAFAAGLWAAGVAGLGLLVLVAGTAPPVVAHIAGLSRGGRRRAMRPGPGATRVDLEPVLSPESWAGPVHALEDQRLFQAWSESFVRLKLTRTTDERAELVNLRQAYLDELESRHAAAFSSWLGSSARPVGDPTTFFEVPEAPLHQGSPSTPEGRQRGAP